MTFVCKYVVFFYPHTKGGLEPPVGTHTNSFLDFLTLFLSYPTMNSGTLGFASPQWMICSVPPCCKATRQGWEGSDLGKNQPPTSAEYVHEPALTHEQTLGFEVLHCFVFCLPGVLPSPANKGSKKGSKTPWGREISLLKTQMGFWCIARCAGEGAQSWCSCSQPRAGTQLSPETPGWHQVLSSRAEPEEGIGRATGLGRAKGISHLEKCFCVHELRLSLKLFLGCLLAPLPFAPSQK